MNNNEDNLDVSGKEFLELSEEEMLELAGASGDMDPEITPTVVVSLVTGGFGGAAISYLTSAKYKC